MILSSMMFWSKDTKQLMKSSVILIFMGLTLWHTLKGIKYMYIQCLYDLEELRIGLVKEA